MLFKKRFFFISILLHGTVLLLLFSWEVPLANRLFSQSILRVSLVETIEKKPQVTKAGPLDLPGRDIAKIREVEGISEVTPADKMEKREDSREEKREVKQEKKEEQKQEQKPEKTEPALAELKEENPGEHEKFLSEDWILIDKTQEPLQVQTKIRPQSYGSESSKTSALSPEGINNPGGRTDSSSIFLAPAGFGKGGEEIPAGGGSSGSGPAKEDEAPLRLTKIPSSSQEIDPILLEIIRKIQSAKRYPKMARKMGIEGTAVVRFKLKPGGQVEAVEVIKSSGYEILDKASLETVRDASPFPYKEGWLKVGIVFKIL